MLPNFLVAVVVVIFFALLAKLTRSLFKRLMKRITDNVSLTSLMGSVLYLTVLALGAFIAWSILKLDGAVTSLLAGAGVIGLALGFALQEIASNFIAGTMMSIRKPFKEGDLIETNDFYGKVEKIHLRTTDLITLQGQYVMIPNAEVFKKPIINYSRLRRRRIDIEVGVHYNTHLAQALDVAVKAVQGISGVKPDDVGASYSEFGSSSINFTIRIWQKFTNQEADYLALRHQAVLAIKQAFDQNGITIPFPMRTLDLGDVNFKEIFSTYREKER